jgi:hypothetical protein
MEDPCASCHQQKLFSFPQIYNNNLHCNVLAHLLYTHTQECTRITDGDFLLCTILATQPRIVKYKYI